MLDTSVCEEGSLYACGPIQLNKAFQEMKGGIWSSWPD
jgi:hypothetical protein